jgi:DNA ligase (NAD+)
MNPIREIIDFLNARTAEYNAGNPTISDKEWDAKYFQLQELEEKTGHRFPDSPTQHIEYQIMDKLNKFTHKIPMRSLAKTKSVEEVDKYFGDDYVGMVKMDGLSVSLTYKEGRLVSAATRGNGEVGEDITHNARVISNIPQTINAELEVIINGEIICPIDVFEENFASDYKNPRNFAAGSIRLLDSKECDTRKLKFVAWDCVYGTNFDTLVERLSLLSLLGFDVVPWRKKLLSTQLVIDWLKIEADKNKYPLDGIVFRFDNIAHGDSLGNTAHHPNHSLAFKFVDESVETYLRNIEYEPSRNGVLTPIAIFEPVELEGSIVSRASLHNLSIMAELNGGYCHVGDELEIIKSNQIIPQVISWRHPTQELPIAIRIPSKCPECGATLEIKESDSGVKTLICPNEKCTCRLINQLDHFCGKKGLDIKGLSKATLEKLIDWGWVNSRLDIFHLADHKAEWVKKPGFGEKSVSNILNAIESAKNTTLAQFIASLGIPLVGTTVSKLLEKKCITYSQFRDDVLNDTFSFADWEGIGPEINHALKTFDYTEADAIYEQIKVCYIEADLVNYTSLEGKRFAITGNVAYGRSKLSELIENHGGTVTSSVSRKTDYLIANQPEDSTKYKNAIAYGTKILTEDEVLKMIDF